jgi:UDP-N-acetylglucosamine enolpyruvyl transferase
VYHVDRGYDDFDGKLRSLGASITRIPESEAGDIGYGAN